MSNAPVTDVKEGQVGELNRTLMKPCLQIKVMGLSKVLIPATVFDGIKDDN